MKKNSSLFTASFLFLLFFAQSCTKDDENKGIKTNYEFTYTSACGWCGGSYELNIIDNIATFEYFAVCDNEPRNYKRELTSNEIESLSLTNLFSEIKPLDINNCGICVDGCDETIKFKEGENEFFIRFRNDNEVEQLLDYINAIRDLFDSINNESLLK